MDSNSAQHNSQSNPEGETSFPHDVMRLVFDQLAGDYDSLCNVSLTCHLWRSLSLPSLLWVVDLSSHNNGHLPEHEIPEILPIVYADYGSQYRPANLVPRQRAFLRLMTAKPDLAKYVMSLAWTLTWINFKERDLTPIDRQTWNVFSRLCNVTELDLASLLDEDFYDDFLHQNPERLFPAVTDLKLLGRMYRGVIKAIVTSLRPGQLRSLELNYLQDEGATPDGEPIGAELAMEHAHHSRKVHWMTYNPRFVADDLYQRQETGKACIFPGPMWLPMRLLSTCSLDSLTHLEVKLAPFHIEIDLRNYYTFFQETAKLMLRASASLKSLVIIFGSCTSHFKEYDSPNRCGTGRIYFKFTWRPWAIKLAAFFLDQAVAALNQRPFPHLDSIRFEGFDLLETANAHEAEVLRLEDTLRSSREYSYSHPNATFTNISNVDGREVFLGYYAWSRASDDILENS